MLDLSDSLIVSSSLCLFMLLVYDGVCAGFIAGSMWLEDTHIEIGRTKEPIGLHIESSCATFPHR